MTKASGSAWLDGRIVPLSEARVPVSDRGFLFADSVFETVRTYDHVPFLLGDHLDRLRRSANKLLLPVPWSDQHLSEVVADLLADWPPSEEAVLRIMVTRGDGGNGIAFPEPQNPRLVVLCRPLAAPSGEFYRLGVKVVLPNSTRGKHHAVPADVTSGSYLANVLALAEARALGGFEALLRGADGSLSEATTSNLFLVKDGILLTPGVGDQILPGITRALVLVLAQSMNLVVSEGRVTEQQLFSADEVFLTSSLKEVLPVCAVGDHVVGCEVPGPLTRELMEAFARRTRALTSQGVVRLSEALPSCTGVGPPHGA